MITRMKKSLFGFTLPEIMLWVCSVSVILISFFIFDRQNYLTLASSLVGVTALIFNAKGNPFGHIFMIGFGIVYAIISYSYAYYGEMITYLGMSVPMAIFSLVTWLRHPYNGNHAEVAVHRLTGKEVPLMLLSTLGVTVAFYFILGALHTTNLLPSTISVTTSFLAAYLTMRRSELYALAYAANDIVLIVLWIMAAMTDISYLSVIICFVVFLFNDMYGYFNWRRMRHKQAKGE